MSSALSAAVAQILADADADIASRRPVCRSSGKCCHFEEYGHRMYVTAAEAIHFAHIHLPTTNEQSPAVDQTSALQMSMRPKSSSLPQFFAQDKSQGCPYQIDKFCTARQARPLGCRIYFCDENAQSWQNDVYEKYHAKLTALHKTFDLSYRYMEWREALREMLLPATGNPGSPPALR